MFMTGRTLKRVSENDLNEKKEFKIPNNIVIIDEHAFENLSIRKILIPPKVEVINDAAFKHCENLEEVKIYNQNAAFGSDVFEGCYSLSKINLPNNMDHIPPGMFAFCENLKYITLPSGIKIIFETAFQSCGINEIYIPNNTQEIYSCAFISCENLKDVYMSDNVTYLDDMMFYDSKNVKIHYRNNIYTYQDLQLYEIFY